MANVINRQTKQYLQSVNTPDYPTSEWIINPDMSSVVGLENRDIVIDGDTVRALNATEKAAALPSRKLELEANVALAANAYGEGYYPPAIEIKFKMMYQQAIQAGLTNRANYIAQALMFEQAVVDEMQDRIEQVRNIAQWEELDNNWLDFSDLDNLLPDVSVKGALEITD